MEYHATIDHFFAYNNIAIFPAKFTKQFPKWTALAYNNFASYVEPNLDDKAIFTIVNSKMQININDFDKLQEIYGYSVVDTNTNIIVYLQAQSEKYKQSLLSIMTIVFPTVYLELQPESETIDRDAELVAKFGFVNPVYQNGVIRVSYEPRIVPKTVVDKIKTIIIALKTDRRVLKVFLPTKTAEVMSKSVLFETESSGKLHISRYAENGTAILGVNTDDILEGKKENAQVPQAQFSYHTHPDKLTAEYKLILNWPSGQDMHAVAHSYFTDIAMALHFVASPTGIWSISMTVGFQSILKALRDARAHDCALAILAAIKSAYTKFEHTEYTFNVEPLKRHAAFVEYLNKVARYKVVNLYMDNPSLAETCQLSKQVAAFPLFKVDYHKWKEFDESDGVEYITEYIPNDEVGLSIWIPPSF
jgi:hypothetical protein